MENVHKGEYLTITDRDRGITYLVQVIDINYIDIPGLTEELVREELTVNEGEEIGFLNLGDILTTLRDVKVLDCEFRGIIRDGQIRRMIVDLPSRSKAIIEKIPSSQVLELLLGEGRRILIGKDLEGFDVFINAEDLDGALTLITGMKGTGKSHLAKLLVLELVKKGAPVMVFDINGEYVGLARRMKDRIKVLYPGENLKFSIDYLEKGIILDILTNVLDLPGVSANFFNDLWPIAEKRGKITIDSLIDVVKSATTNIMVKDALLTRLMTLRATKFIRDNGQSSRIEDLIKAGTASIIVLRDLPPLDRRILVEILLSKFVSLLLNEKLPSFFLFAEEAHLYVRQTYWEDIITRMRHFGLFVIFITNQLESLDQRVFKQLDNVFLFSFKNDGDLERISKISDADVKTIKTMVKDLPRGVCLIIGKVVSSMPLVVQVRDIGDDALGRTRFVFRNAF